MRVADSLPRVRLDLADASGVEAAVGAEFSWRWEVARRRVFMDVQFFAIKLQKRQMVDVGGGGMVTLTTETAIAGQYRGPNGSKCL